MPDPEPPQETQEPEEEEENQEDTDTDETIPYGSAGSDDTLDYNDLVIEDDDKTWCFLTQEQKICEKRKEATQQEKRDFAKQFLDAKKAECQSWIEKEVFDLVDMRKMKDKNDVMFVGQRIEWKTHEKYGACISVDQKLAVDAVEEVKIDKTLKDNIQCNPQLHTAYRSVLGQLNWLQSRTQVHLCYKFSRCASADSSPTIGDVREINTVARTLKSQYVDGRFWPLKGQQRILGMPDASYRNNSDKSSQRAHVLFLAEDRKIPPIISHHTVLPVMTRNQMHQLVVQPLTMRVTR
eukprot:s227_g15.t1